MVGEIEGYAGKAEAVSLLGAAHARYPCHIAIGYEIYFVVILTPIVVVLRHKQQVAAHKLIFAIEHLVAYTQIEKSGAAVAPGDNYGFANTIAVVAIAYGFEQKLTRQHLNVGESGEAQSRSLQCGNLSGTEGCNGVAQACGIAQHARVAALPHHIGEREAIHTKPVGTEHAGIESRALVEAHRRQLGSVAKEDKAAVGSRIHIVHKVVEQAPRAKRHSIG